LFTYIAAGSTTLSRSSAIRSYS